MSYQAWWWKHKVWAAIYKQYTVIWYAVIWPPRPPLGPHDLHNKIYILTTQKWALDKLRFELTLYGFFSKQKCDLIVSIVWRSWRSKWRSRWSQRWFAWRLTTSDFILISIWSSTTSRQWRQFDPFFVSRKKSVQCKLRSFLIIDGREKLQVCSLNSHGNCRQFLGDSHISIILEKERTWWHLLH